MYVGYSFFLFCNVFRIGNRAEVFWYVPFLLVVLYAYYCSEHFWWWILLACEPLKVVVVVVCIFRGRYRGIFSRRPGPARRG